MPRRKKTIDDFVDSSGNIVKESGASKMTVVRPSGVEIGVLTSGKTLENRAKRANRKASQGLGVALRGVPKVENLSDIRKKMIGAELSKEEIRTSRLRKRRRRK